MRMNSIFSFYNKDLYPFKKKDHHLSDDCIYCLQQLWFSTVQNCLVKRKGDQRFHGKGKNLILLNLVPVYLTFSQTTTFLCAYCLWDAIKNLVGKGQPAFFSISNSFLFLHFFLLCKLISVNAKFNSLPHSPDFKRPCIRSLLKTLWEKEKLLVVSISSFSNTVFYTFQNKFQVFSHIYCVLCKCFTFGLVQNFVVR